MFRTLAFAAAFAGVACAAAAAEWKKLITPEELAALDPAPLVLDIRPAVSAKNVAGYDGGHIPGAVSAPYGWFRGPKQNPGQAPSDEALTEALRKAGVTRERPVVVAHLGDDSSDFGAAARVYWTLKSAGLERIAILDGGTLGWWLSGRPLTTEPTPAPASDIVAALSDQWRADLHDVRDVVAGKAQAVLLDARPEAFYKGEKKHPAANKAGTIPGAKQLDNLGLFPGGGPKVGEAEPLISQIKAAGIAGGHDPVISFCNTGHWAATNWFFASEIAGIDNVKLYAESMVEWTNKGQESVDGQ